VIPVCAGAAVTMMLLVASANDFSADGCLNGVWVGLTTLMLMRSLTIYWPYWRRTRPFDKLFG
jgi:hypothetical protein